MLWISWDGWGSEWEPFSLSYHHNLGVAPEHRFTSMTNDTWRSNCPARESSAATSLFQTGPDEFVVLCTPLGLLRLALPYCFAAVCLLTRLVGIRPADHPRGAAHAEGRLSSGRSEHERVWLVDAGDDLGPTSSSSSTTAAATTVQSL